MNELALYADHHPIVAWVVVLMACDEAFGIMRVIVGFVRRYRAARAGRPRA